MSDPQWEEVEDSTTILAAYKPVFLHVLGMVTKAAVELGVFNVLAVVGPDAELTAGEIAGKLHVNINEKGTYMLDHMLKFLTVHAILKSSSTAEGDGRRTMRYGLAPAGRLMANTDHQLSFAPLLLTNLHKDSINSWNCLGEAVKEGENPFRRVHGETMYDHMTRDPSLANIFNEAMKNQSNMLTKNIINKYNDGFMQINELIDVGGGTGATLGKIISKFPHIKGINFDLSHVISEAPSISGVEHVCGDMFDVIPSCGAILLKWVLHNWNDERCLTILKNCWRALPISGKVIVVEYILPESSESNDATAHAYALSMAMMTLFDGAERTEKEFRSLAQTAFFSEFKISCKSLNYSIMEFVKGVDVCI